MNEISLPDEIRRLHILQTLTKKMKDNSFLSPDVDLQQLAARTKNYSRPELELLVRLAQGNALSTQLLKNEGVPTTKGLKLTMGDFTSVMDDVKPAFGASSKDLELCR